MPSLDEELENWQVDSPGMWENPFGPDGWFAVSNDREGIIAYFYKESDACRFRLDMINKALNG